MKDYVFGIVLMLCWTSVVYDTLAGPEGRHEEIPNKEVHGTEVDSIHRELVLEYISV